MSSGRIVQIIGAVIDVEFPRDEVPKVYDALVVEGKNLTMEVQQQLGDGVVRAIAMGSSEGISRGLAVTNTKSPIQVPVGIATLGRIMDVLGNPIDECGPIGEEERASIHRKAPTYEELSASDELLETGIKVIDLVCPFANHFEERGAAGVKGAGHVSVHFSGRKVDLKGIAFVVERHASVIAVVGGIDLDVVAPGGRARQVDRGLLTARLAQVRPVGSVLGVVDGCGGGAKSQKRG